MNHTKYLALLAGCWLVTACENPVDGDLNVDAGNSFTDEAFYEKTVFETRVFRPEFYLFPIPQSEINRDPQIVQNPGW